VIKYNLVLLLILFIVGCSSKSEQNLMKNYQGSKSYYKYLQKTEKVQFKENNETKILVTATYINNPTINIDDKSDEVFIVGIYHEDYEIKSLNSEKFSLTLREVKSKRELKEKLDKEKQLALQSLDNNMSNNIIPKRNKKRVDYLKPISVELLEKNNPLLKNISFVSAWNQFYLVHFKHISGNRLYLRIRNRKSEIEDNKEKLYDTAILNFAKIAKYAL